MSRYTPLASVQIVHQYFTGNGGPIFQFTPTMATASLMSRLGLILRSAPHRLNLFMDEDQLDALRLELAQSPSACLTFKVFTTDQTFKNYTEPRVQRPGFVLCFDGGSVEAGPMENPAPLHADAFVTEASFRDLKEVFRDEAMRNGEAPAAIEAARTEEELASLSGLMSVDELVARPDCIVRLALDKLVSARERHPAGQHFSIKFRSRETIWKYYLLGPFNKDVPGITDLNNQTEFEFTGKESLPGGRTALTFRSKTPIPLQERYDVRFQLRDGGVPDGKVLIRRLPVASATQFGKETINERQTIVSEIYINF